MVIDVVLPDLSGVELTRQLHEAHPSIGIIGMSGYVDRHYDEAVKEAGARGYVSKTSPVEELEAAIKTVAGGGTWFTDSDGERTAGPGSAERVAALAQLTDREREVLTLIAAGVATRQIAARLEVSVKTVESHRRNVMHKVGLFSVAELTKYAIRVGLAEL